MQGNTDIELVVYKRQMSQYCLGVTMTFAKVPFTVTVVQSPEEYKNHKTRLEEARKKSNSTFSRPQFMCLPALHNKKTNDVIYGPEAIGCYLAEIVLKGSNVNTFGTNPEERVRFLEMRTVFMDVYYQLMRKAEHAQTSKQDVHKELTDFYRLMNETRLSKIDRAVQECGTDSYFDSGLSFADCFIFVFYKWMEHCVPGVAQKHPKIKTIADRIEKTTDVKNYVESGRLFSGIGPQEVYAEDICTYVWGLDY